MSARAPHQPTSNLRLALYGLALGLFPLLYPLLLSAVPDSLASRLPFNQRWDHHGAHWTSTQRYQESSPRAANHDPFDLKGPEEEKLRRFGSKDGDRERDKDELRERRIVEMRAQLAGDENKLHTALPVYFVEQGIATTSAPIEADSDFGKALFAVGKEIKEQIVPKRVIILHSLKSTAPHLVLSSHAQSNLLPIFHEADVPAARGHIHLPGWNMYLDLPRSIAVDQVGLPLGGHDWGVEKWLAVGRALQAERDEGTVILAIGPSTPRKAAMHYPQALVDALSHHTAGPREEYLMSMFAGPGARTNVPVMVDPNQAGLLVAVGASGMLEGHEVKEFGWRFGDVPL